MSEDELQDFGRAELFDAEAIGKPGSRRFRLIARSRSGTAALWLERSQLEALGEALDKLLARLADGMLLRTEASASGIMQPSAPPGFPRHPDVEFQVGPMMQLGYDDEDDLVLFRAAPLEIVEEDGFAIARDDVEPSFSILFSRTQAELLSTHISGVLSGGRPRCPFCGQPIEGTHVCEKQNGFHPVILN